MKRLIISSIVLLLSLSCSSASNTQTQKPSSPSLLTPHSSLVRDTSSPSLVTRHPSLNFSDLENDYKSFSTKALSDAYVSRMFNKFLVTTPNPTQVIRQLEFARYLKDVKSDSSYFNSLKTIISNDNTIFTKIDTTSGVPQKKSAESATFGTFVDSLNPNPFITSGLVLNLDAGNVASYPGSGNTWIDLSGSGNNGTLINGVGYISSNSGSLVFDGVDDYVSSSVIEPSSRLTLESWFKMTGPSNTNDLYGGFLIVSSSQLFGGVLQYFLQVSYLNKRIGFGVQTNTGVLFTADNVVNVNTWYNTICVYDGSTRKIYLNGNLIASDNYNINPIYPNSGDRNARIGKWGYSGFPRNFNGNISVARIYSRALSATEVLQNYNGLKGRYGL